MIFLSRPTHSHDFKLEREGYAELPKMNLTHPPVMWGQIDKCACGQRRWISPKLKDMGAIGETPISPAGQVNTGKPGRRIDGRD